MGCSAGFLNAVKIKGTHTAMKSGMLAAEALFPRLAGGEGQATVATSTEGGAEFFPSATTAAETTAVPAAAIEISEYETALRASWVGKELYAVRNTHAAFHYGTLAGMVHTALSCFVTRGKEPWYAHHMIAAMNTHSLGRNQSDQNGTNRNHLTLTFTPGLCATARLTRPERSRPRASARSPTRSPTTS